MQPDEIAAKLDALIQCGYVTRHEVDGVPLAKRVAWVQAQWRPAARRYKLTRALKNLSKRALRPE